MMGSLVPRTDFLPSSIILFTITFVPPEHPQGPTRQNHEGQRDGDGPVDPKSAVQYPARRIGLPVKEGHGHE